MGLSWNALFLGFVALACSVLVSASIIFSGRYDLSGGKSVMVIDRLTGKTWVLGTGYAPPGKTGISWEETAWDQLPYAHPNSNGGVTDTLTP
jgi:hypothetical protein